MGGPAALSSASQGSAQAEEDQIIVNYGQRLRPKAPTGPPVAPTLVQQEKPSFLEEDAPVLERDEGFQTLESQNKAPPSDAEECATRAKRKGLERSMSFRPCLVLLVVSGPAATSSSILKSRK